jgi:hypothetical protein
MGRDLPERRAAPVELRESVAAGVRKIDGADESNRDQEQDSGEEGIDDHINLPKNSLSRMHAGHQSYIICFQQDTSPKV